MRFNVAIRNICIVFFFLTLLPSNVSGQDALVLSVELNTVPVGETFGYITEGGDILLKSEFLKDIGLQVDTGLVVIEGLDYVSLSSLAPELAYDFDNRSLALAINADPDLLGKSFYDLGRVPPEDLVYLEQNSAFLNYSLNYSVEKETDIWSMDVPLEAGVRMAGTLFYSSFDYSKSEEDQSFSRLLSQVVRDNRNSLVRYTLGDFNASSGELGGGAIIGGLNIQKNYSIDPFYPRYNSLDYEGSVSSPTDVEIWKDGTLIKRIKLGPGRFRFEDLPITAGSGAVVLVFKDAFGREERVEIPYYHSASILRKGIHEFSYSAGAIREDLGGEESGYSDRLFMATHRYGLAGNLTVGIRGEFREDIDNAGASVVFTLGRNGLIEANASASKSDSGDGNAWLTRYSYTPSRGGINFSVKQSGYSLEYGNLSLVPGADKPESSRTASLSFSLGRLGTLSTNYSEDKYYLTDDLKRFTANYSTKLFQKLSLSTGWSRTETLDTADEYHASLNFTFGNNMSANAFYSESDDQSEGSLSVQKSVSERKGFGYRLSGQRITPDVGQEIEIQSADLDYYGKYGIVTGRTRSTDGVRSHDLSVRGSVAFLGGAFYIGQPVNDSFAVVKVGSSSDVQIFHENAPVARTGSEGKVYVPYLGSYYPNKLAVEELDLPFYYSLQTDEMNVSVPYRGGALVEFAIDKIQHVVGKLNVVQNGETKPAKYWGLRIDTGVSELVTPVGSSGQFYLENIPAGTHPVVVYKGEKECRFELGIPESEEAEIDIGTVTCTLD